MTDCFPSMLWTVMPMELVTDGFSQPAGVAVREIEGRLVEVLPAGNGSWTVQRLLSTDPADFLDPRWQPGRQVQLPPER